MREPTLHVRILVLHGSVSLYTMGVFQFHSPWLAFHSAYILIAWGFVKHDSEENIYYLIPSDFYVKLILMYFSWTQV